jgi:hypothetical protein
MCAACGAIDEASRVHAFGRGLNAPSIGEVIDVARAGGVAAVRALCEVPS